jgi:hypothetical protein
MKLGLAVLAVLLAFGASSVEAGRKFPKPVDSPVVRPKVKESHKTGSRTKHLMEGSRISDAAVPSDRVRA